MPTTSFTTRMDKDLKSELEQIARYEDRSASYIANQAIQAFVDERKATRELLDLGLEMIDQGAKGLSAQAIHHWMQGDEDHPFTRETDQP